MTEQPANFLGLGPPFSDYDPARVALLPIPYDATASYLAGTRHGPAAIIEASQHVEWFDEELGRELHRCGITTLEPVPTVAAGPEAMHQEIYRRARRVVRDGKFLIGVGGEHGITSALIRATAQRHRNLSVLQIDAHTDLRDTFQGSAYSHACVMRRSLDYVDRVVAVGIRSMSIEEHRFIKKAAAKASGCSITVVEARDCRRDDEWIERALTGLGETVYVTIDIDGFDPAYAPGTGTPEPGGMDWFQVTSLLRRVAGEKRIVGADVVEVLPQPGQAITEFLAARLIYKLIAYVEFARRSA